MYIFPASMHLNEENIQKLFARALSIVKIWAGLEEFSFPFSLSQAFTFLPSELGIMLLSLPHLLPDGTRLHGGFLQG